MADTNKGSKEYFTDAQKNALDVIKNQPIENLELIIEKLNHDGIIIDLEYPSFYSPTTMKHWHPKLEEYLRDESKKTKIHYTGEELIIGYSKISDSCCLINLKKYSYEEGVEYMDNTNRES